MEITAFFVNRTITCFIDKEGHNLRFFGVKFHRPNFYPCKVCDKYHVCFLSADYELSLSNIHYMFLQSITASSLCIAELLKNFFLLNNNYFVSFCYQCFLLLLVYKMFFLLKEINVSLQVPWGILCYRSQ